jgi:hypothetical protein
VRLRLDQTGYCCLRRDVSLFLVVFLYKGTNTIVREDSQRKKNRYIFLPLVGNKARHEKILKINYERKRMDTVSKKYKISFYVKDEHYNQLLARAEACNMKINAFAKQLVLDRTDSVKLKRGAATTMANLYAWAEQTTDMAAREYMRKAGDLLWQSLK